MFDILLTDDPATWPWSAYFNLPFIPISLIVSRAQRAASIPFIIPVLLIWPPALPVGLREQLLREYWTDPENARQLALSAHPSKRVWPPSPVAFGMVLVPLVRAVYRMLYSRLALWVLGAKAASLLPGGRRRPNGAPIRGGQVENNVNVAIGGNDDHDVPPAEDDGAAEGPVQNADQQQQVQHRFFNRVLWRWNGLAVGIRGVRVVRDQGGDNQNGGAGNGQQQQRVAVENDDANAANNEGVVLRNGLNQNQNVVLDPEADDRAAAVIEAAEQQIELNTTSLGRQFGGALLIPAISSWMGSLLFRLSRHSDLLRRLLGISSWAFSHPNESGLWYKKGMESFPGGLLLFPPPPHGPWSYGGWDGLSTWQKYVLTLKLGVNTFWGGTRTWAESDPVWWRNSVGLGLFVVVRPFFFSSCH